MLLLNLLLFFLKLLPLPAVLSFELIDHLDQLLQMVLGCLSVIQIDGCHSAIDLSGKSSRVLIDRGHLFCTAFVATNARCEHVVGVVVVANLLVVSMPRTVHTQVALSFGRFNTAVAQDVV